MEPLESLVRVLRRGHRTFLLRRVVEAACLGSSVFLPALLGAVLLGLLLGAGRLGAWAVPLLVGAGAVAGIYRSIRFGVRHHLSFGAFLLLTESRAGLARNELLNALHLGRRVPSFEDPLAREVASEVLRRGTETARSVPFRSLAPARSLRGPAGQVAGSLGCLVVLSLLAPGAVLRTAGQIVRPGQVPETPGIEIVVEPGDCTAERGGSVIVRARLQRASGEPVLFHRAGGGAWEREPMQPVEDSFSRVLADLQAETEYAVAIAETRSRTYRITLVEPLRATGYEKRIRYPAYTGFAPEKELSPHASIAALFGSEADLMVSVSRPDARGILRFDSGRTVPLSGTADGVLNAQLAIRELGRFRVELSSEKIQGPPWISEPFQIDPIPDRMPSLYLLAPGEQIDLPPEMRVVLEVDCADDFGITRLDLSYKRNNGPAARMTIARWQGGTEARVLYPWNLEEITMAPGDRIAYHLELTDNDAISGPKTTISPEYLIRFPTVEEMYAQQEAERQEGIVGLRESLDSQVDLRKQLEKISQDLRESGSMQWEQKQEVEQLMKRQEEIAQKMEDLAANMDRQLDRMQQGQLFSPEMLQKIAQIQDLVRQIQNPEFQKRMEQMREAMRSLDPKEVQKALQEMKLTQKDLEQGLDRTLKMLERLLAEEKLDELIKKSERLTEEQNQVNRDLATSQDGQKPDSTSSLSDQEAQALKDRQEQIKKELEDLKKQMDQLKEMADKSHKQMADKLAGEQGQKMKESAESAEEEMQSGSKCMAGGSRPGAIRSGKKASKSLRELTQQMKQLQSQIGAAQMAELSKKLLGLAEDLVELSQRQEGIVDGAGRANTRDLAVEQDRLARATGSVVDQIYELARETPAIPQDLVRALGGVVNTLADATDAYETGQRRTGSALGQKAQATMDAVVSSLLESNQSMCSGSGSSSCKSGAPNPMGKMQSLSLGQSGVNQDTQQLMGEMQGSRLQQEGGSGRLEQLAARQMAIRQGLQEVSQSMGDRGDVLGRLDELGKEMEETVKDLRERKIDERVLQRQEKILSRLLTAQRSLRRQDFEEQRRSRTGVDPDNPVSPPPVETGLSQREQIRRGILRGSQDQVPVDFRSLVDRYFRALMEGGEMIRREPRRPGVVARLAAPLALCLMLSVEADARQEAHPGPDQSSGTASHLQSPADPQAVAPLAQLSPEREKLGVRDRLLRQVRTLARGGNCEGALKLLDTMEQGGSGDPVAIKLRGDCLRKLGRFDEVKELYRREADAMAGRGDEATPLLVELERVMRESGDAQAAFAVCLEIHRYGTAGAWVRDEMEGLILADSLGDRSVAALKEEIRNHPQDPDLGSLLIGALLFLGKDADALQEAQSLDSAQSAHGKVMLSYLRMMNEKGMGAPVVACADAALAQGLTGEDAQEALYMKAGAQRRTGDLRRAVESYDKAAKAAPSGPLVHVALRERADLLVRDLHDLEAGAAAQEDLIATLERAPAAERGLRLGQALVDLANTKLRMGRYEEAAAVCKRVEEEAKEQTSKEDAAFLQAEILFYAGKIDEARTAYERVAHEFAGGNRVNDSLDRMILLTRAGDAGALPLAALGQIAYQRRFGDPAHALAICQDAERECGGCSAEEDFLREESLLLLDLGRLDEAAVRADTLAARFPEAGASPAVLRAVADRIRERDGESDAVLHRYENLLVRFPKSHDAFEVRALLEKLRRTG